MYICMLVCVYECVDVFRCTVSGYSTLIPPSSPSLHVNWRSSGASLPC